MEVDSMPAITLSLKGYYGSAGEFKGVIEPAGITGYAFSGTLTASCPLDRSRMSFANAVRLGHGGTSSEYTYLEHELARGDISTFSVKGEGARLPNETVDFRLGFNEGINGEFKYGDKVICHVGGPSQKVLASYTTKDVFGKTSYDVGFAGSARADGPKNYVVEGTLDAYIQDGKLTTQFVTIGHGSQSDSWHYSTYPSSDIPKKVKVFGTRNVGEKIMVVVGATSQVANLYGYGDAVIVEIPDLF
jgi:hypothetical protein